MASLVKNALLTNRLFESSGVWCMRSRGLRYRDTRMRNKGLMETEEADLPKHFAEFEELTQEAHRERLRKQRLVKYKTLERKYYPKPKDVNMLTWGAQEQIRRLHGKDPEAWDVLSLAQVFPVSEENVVKIISSTYKPKNLTELQKYDSRVTNRWIAIRDREVKGLEGGLRDMYQYLLERGKVPLLANAAGAEGLPMPDLHNDLIEQNKSISDVNPNFSWKKFFTDVMLQDQQKMLENCSDPPDKERTSMEIISRQRQELLEEIAFPNLEKEEVDISSRDVAFIESRPLENEKRLQVLSADNKPRGRKAHDRPRMTSEEYLKTFGAGSGISSRSLFGKMENDEDIGLTLDVDRQSAISYTELRKDGREQVKPRPLDGSRDRRESTGLHAGKSLKEEVPGNKRNSRLKKELYMFDPAKGYIHPFGKSTDLIPDRIDNHSARMVKQGEAVYDNDGEFFYKVPR